MDPLINTIGEETVRGGLRHLVRLLNPVKLLSRRRSVSELWRGEWYAYHFTEVVDHDEHGNEVIRPSISCHKYDFSEYHQFSRYHATVADNIVGDKDPKVYQLRVKEIPEGFQFEITDVVEHKRKKIHIEVFPSPFDDRGEYKGQPVAGCIIGMTTKNKHFASSIILSKTQPDIDQQDLHSLDKYINSAQGIIFRDIYRESEYLRHEAEAKRILEVLESRNFKMMPPDATESEVDKLIDLMVGSGKTFSQRIFEAILDAETPIPVIQYWSCHLHGTSNRSTISAMNEKISEIKLLIWKCRDSYTSIQLLRAFEKWHVAQEDFDSFVREIFLADQISSMLMAWAYALMPDDVRKLEPVAARYSAKKDLIVASIKEYLGSANERQKYIACCLVPHFPDFELNRELEALQRNKVRFVREAAILAIIHRKSVWT